jgi:formiminotetrahydrofolate cyclodeaminase
MSDSAGTLWNASLGNFRDATASAEPTPGGGSVAGVSATLGLGLVIMALEISAKRKDAREPEKTAALIGEARAIMAELSADADRDVLAFQDYMAAARLPKFSDEEKRTRRAALDAAARRATEAPLLAARHIVDGLRLAGLAAPFSHLHVVSDVGAGAGLLDGALKAILFNVDVNLPSLSDPALQAACAQQRTGLASEGAEFATRVLAAVAGRLATRQ